MYENLSIISILILLCLFIGLIIFWIYYERKGKGRNLTSTTPFATLLMPTLCFLFTIGCYFLKKMVFLEYCKIDNVRDLHNYTHLLGEDFEQGLSTLESIFGNLLPEIARGPRLAEAMMNTDTFISIGNVCWILALLCLGALYYLILSRKEINKSIPTASGIAIFLLFTIVVYLDEVTQSSWSGAMFGVTNNGVKLKDAIPFIILLFAMYRHFSKRIKVFYSQPHSALEGETQEKEVH